MHRHRTEDQRGPSSRAASVLLGLAAMLAMLAVVVVSVGAAFAHGGRGVVVHEHASAKPAPGYEPPPPATLGGKPFELIDHDGATVTDATWRGKWRLMFFGFAGCREACPVGLDRMGEALNLLGPLGETIQPLFIDIDYAGPDLIGLKQFVGHFHPRLVGLTGNRRQIFLIVRDFQVRREIKHGLHGKKETGPRIDHSTYFFVVDPEGRTRSYFHHTETPADMAAHMRRQLEAP